MTVAYLPELSDPARIGLKHCLGYRVYSPDGYQGTVANVLCDREDEPATICVRGGLFVARRRQVPMRAVNRVVPAQRRVEVGHVD